MDLYDKKYYDEYDGIGYTNKVFQDFVSPFVLNIFSIHRQLSMSVVRMVNYLHI